RCEDCLPLVEEYADGEVDEMTGRMMSAHLAACPDCSDALEAVRVEQELFARYERPVAVTPALWQRVRAEINLEELATPPQTSVPPFARLRETLAAALGSLAARPAFASALAVAAVALASGAVWLSLPGGPATPGQVAGGGNVTRPAGQSPAVAAEGRQGSAGVVREVQRVGETEDETDVTAVARKYPIEADPRRGAQPVRFTNVSMATTPAGSGDVVALPEDHLAVREESAVLASLPYDDSAGVVRPERQLDPEEKDVARHVEQAQMLLRSFKNAEASDLSYEKRLSQRLLDENAALKVGAEVADDKGTRQVLDAIEPFLLDIKNLRDQPTREEVRSIRERMKKNEIIAALQVY
ncbi:MAG TPA: zf-HC2 domain-containing protein, partial [Pyrinomonadaceae bacterium]|nr:zf-HC2 domain-containing protein [Pyrinomonadaceae bacterium]